MKNFHPTMTMAEAGAEGGNAGDNKMDGTQGPDAAGGETGGGDGKAASGGPYRPEGLADHLAGADDRETIDKLWTAYSGARESLSKGKDGVPAKPEDYKLDLPPEILDKVIRKDESGVDPVLAKMQGIFHKHGIPAAAFSEIAGDVYKAAAALNAAKEGDADGGGDFVADFAFKDMGGVEKARPAMDGVNAWIAGLKNQGKLDDAEVEELSLMSLHSQGLKTLMKLREMAGEKPIPLNLSQDGGGEGKITEADLNLRVADPRYRKGGKEYDPAFYAETEKMFRAFYSGQSSAA